MNDDILTKMIHCRLLGLLTIISMFLLCQSNTYNDTNTLYKKLFSSSNYNKNILPLTDQRDILNVTVALQLDGITEFDEQTESLTTAGYLILSWKDESLVWEPRQYNFTHRLFVPQNEIWKPDITLRNTYNEFDGLGNDYYMAKVMYDGSVTWVPFQTLKSSCPLDVAYYPFDTQSCDLKFIAWNYKQTDIQFIESSYRFEYESITSSTWKAINSKVVFDNRLDVSVTYILRLKRKPLFYVLNIILPVVLLSFLNVITFVLPVKSGERASYSVTVFLSLAVFLTIIASEVPKNSDKVSLLSVYIILMISISTLYVTISIFEQRLDNRPSSETIGRGYLLIYRLVESIRCRNNRHRQKVSDSQIDIEKLEPAPDVTWSDVIDSMDFVFFWFGMIVTCVSTITIMVMLCTS